MKTLHLTATRLEYVNPFDDPRAKTSTSRK
jgi:hypothetical protein